MRECTRAGGSLLILAGDLAGYTCSVYDGCTAENCRRVKSRYREVGGAASIAFVQVNHGAFRETISPKAVVIAFALGGGLR